MLPKHASNNRSTSLTSILRQQSMSFEGNTKFLELEMFFMSLQLSAINSCPTEKKNWTCHVCEKLETSGKRKFRV